MVNQSDIDTIETTQNQFRFQFRDSTAFDELTNPPEWAQKTAQTISDGATVRMGRVPDSDALEIESVMIPRKPNLGEAEAKEVAEKIVEEIQS